MKLIVEPATKVLIARYGAVKLFGDPDERKAMDEPTLIKLFDSVWTSTLENAIRHAEPCPAQDAFKRISPNNQAYFDLAQEHRQFRLQYQNVEFIAQLQPLGPFETDVQLTQLWRVASSDLHPKTLFVNFPTVEEREKFRNLGQFLGIKDEELGLQLVLDFMAKFPGRAFE